MIMEALNEDEGNDARYDEQRDMFVVSNSYDDTVEEFPAMKFEDGHIYYPIGSGSWVWSEDEEESAGIVELREFRKQMTESLHELWDTLESGDYDSKFDLKIEWNGKKIDLPMHADIYSRFERFIEETIEEEQE